MTLRTTEQYSNNASLFSITTDEEKLKQLFHDIDFDDCGYINYSEFLAACLARKEGLRREYAELIFQLWAMEGRVSGRVDREHNGVISIQDLHLFFGDDIPVGARRSLHLRPARSRPSFGRPSGAPRRSSPSRIWR